MNELQYFLFILALLLCFVAALACFIALRNGLLVVDVYYGLALVMLAVIITIGVLDLFECSKGIPIKSQDKTHTLSEDQLILFIPIPHDMLNLINIESNILELRYESKGNQLHIVQNYGILPSAILRLKLDGSDQQCRLFVDYKDLAEINTPGLCMFFELSQLENMKKMVKEHAAHISIVSALIEGKKFKIYYNCYSDVIKDKETLKKFLMSHSRFNGKLTTRYLRLIEQLFVSFPSDVENNEKDMWLDAGDGMKAVALLTLFSPDEMLCNNNLEPALNEQVKYVLSSIEQKIENDTVMSYEQASSCLVDAIKGLFFENKVNTYLYNMMFEDYILKKNTGLTDLMHEDIMSEGLCKYIFAIASYCDHGNAIRTNRSIRALLDEAGHSDLVNQVDSVLDKILNDKIIADSSEYKHIKIADVLRELSMDKDERSYTGQALIMRARDYVERKYLSHMLIEECFSPMDLYIQKICLISGTKSQVSVDSDSCKQVLPTVREYVA